ncbi:MAG: hypothetical protein ACTHN3_02980 [Solirubrobacterales bacterium]
MKHLKMLGLAVLAAGALSALIGAGTASATVLCSTNTNPCTGTKYPSGTSVSGSLVSGTNAVLVTGSGEVTCTKSTISGKTTSAGSSTTTVTGEITAVSFTGCTESVFHSSCTVTSENLPWKVEVHSSSTNGNGAMTAFSSGKGNPGAIVECSFFVNCTYSTTSATLSVTGGNPAKVLASKVPLAATTSGTHTTCPSNTATWTAEYEITTPKPLFVEGS